MRYTGPMPAEVRAGWGSDPVPHRKAHDVLGRADDVGRVVAEELGQGEAAASRVGPGVDAGLKAIQAAFAKADRQRRRDTEHVEIRTFECE